MPFWQNLLRGVAGTGTALFQPRVTYVGGEQLAHLVDPSGLTATQMWQSQPHVRTVVSFLARNIAQLGLHTFERVNDTDRRRDHASPAARALAHVDGTMTTHELIYSLVVDLCLYDRAYWWVSLSSDSPSGWVIRRLPPEWVRPVQKNAWEVVEYQVFVGKAVETVPADTILDFRRRAGVLLDDRRAPRDPHRADGVREVPGQGLGTRRARLGGPEQAGHRPRMVQ